MRPMLTAWLEEAVPSSDMDFQGDRPTIADHRGRQGLTQPG